MYLALGLTIIKYIIEFVLRTQYCSFLSNRQSWRAKYNPRGRGIGVAFRWNKKRRRGLRKKCRATDITYRAIGQSVTWNSMLETASIPTGFAYMWPLVSQRWRMIMSRLWNGSVRFSGRQWADSELTSLGTMSEALHFLLNPVEGFGFHQKKIPIPWPLGFYFSL